MHKFGSSSAVEQHAVNVMVVGPIPTSRANKYGTNSKCGKQKKEYCKFMKKNLNQIVFWVIIIIAIAIISFGVFRSKISDTKLFALNEKCAVKAKEYAQKQTGSDSLGTSVVQVEHSIYNTKKKSCFTEVNVAVLITDKNSPYQDYSEVKIYDLLKEKTAISWIYDGAEQWEKRGQLNSLQEYEKVKKEIFGLGFYE